LVIVKYHIRVLAMSTGFSETQAQNGTPFSKRDLASWWKNFKRNAKKDEEKGPSFGMIAQLSTVDTGDAY